MFSQEDFNEHSPRLCIIIMNKLKKPLLTSFHSLSDRHKKKFNKLLNEYIQSLPKEDWLPILEEDFNELCLDNIFTDDFDPSKTYCPDVNMNLQLLSNEKEEEAEAEH